MTWRPGSKPGLGQPWEEAGEEKKRKRGWQRLVGTEDAHPGYSCPCHVINVRIDGERLRNLTEAPEGLMFPFPVSRGVANSPEELRWRE